MSVCSIVYSLEVNLSIAIGRHTWLNIEKKDWISQEIVCTWSSPGTWCLYHMVMVAHFRSNPWYLICWRQLIRVKAFTNRIFRYGCTTCYELRSNLSTMFWGNFMHVIHLQQCCCNFVVMHWISRIFSLWLVKFQYQIIQIIFLNILKNSYIPIFFLRRENFYLFRL